MEWEVVMFLSGREAMVSLTPENEQDVALLELLQKSNISVGVVKADGVRGLLKAVPNTGL